MSSLLINEATTPGLASALGDLITLAGWLAGSPTHRRFELHSSKPEGIDSYSLTLLSRDIVGIIDHFGREKVTVVAHDWGALVLWDICMSDLHSRIEKAIVLNVPHPYVMQQTLRTSWTQMKNSWYMLFFQFPWVPEAKLSKYVAWPAASHAPTSLTSCCWCSLLAAAAYQSSKGQLPLAYRCYCTVVASWHLFSCRRAAVCVPLHLQHHLFHSSPIQPLACD